MGCRPYVLPERYTVSFTDDGNAEELRPKGILFVKLIEAVDVPRMDLFSESDPYGRCHFLPTSPVSALATAGKLSVLIKCMGIYCESSPVRGRQRLIQNRLLSALEVDVKGSGVLLEAGTSSVTIGGIATADVTLQDVCAAHHPNEVDCQGEQLASKVERELQVPDPRA